MTTAPVRAPVDGTVEFVQHVLPGLEAGAYMLEVSQTLSTQAAAPTNRYFFAVSSPRFALNPADVFAVYPPDKAVGEFDGTLPHVVLVNRTLPWQRYPTLDQPPRFFPDSQHDRDVPSWLAVFLFDADDEAAFPGFHAQARAGKVRDLFIPQTSGAGIGHSIFWEAGSVGPTSAGLEAYLDHGETPDDAVQFIDVPMGLFWKVAPSVEDLEMMAHVRNVNLISKATENGVPAGRGDLSSVPGTSDFSLTFGNRLPKTGVRSFAHLVSLEGLAGFLPLDPAASDDAGEITLPSQAVGDGGAPVSAIAKDSFMRLVSLACWSFTSTGDSSHFEQVVRNLAPKTAGPKPDYTLGLPMPAPAPGEPVETAAARKVLGMGYTALRHHTRDGGATVSWYRGPLLPGPLTVKVLPDSLASSDAATAYDPASGMFDLSYAGAWQIGRLLGVQDKRFSSLLVNWRRQNLLDAVARMEALVVQQSLDDIQAQLRDDSLIYPLLQAFVPSPAPSATAPTAGAMQGRARRANAHRAALTDAGTLTPLMPDTLQAPLEIYKWLAALKLLQGVPFRYLVPDEAMLPPESIRFFHLDINWVDALIDGALSIGRSGSATSTEAAHDVAVRPLLQGSANVHARRIRRLALRLAAPAPARVTMTTAAGAQGQPLEAASGFLIRSDVVKGWPGLEVNGYAGDGTLLDIVRFERLAPTVLLCLFEKDGKRLARLDVHEPAEGLHFGLSGGGGAVNVRYNHQQDASGPGAQAPGVVQPAPFRGAADERRVVRLFRLSRALLDPKYAAYITGVYSGFDHLPSSQFAMQMLRGVGLVSFELEASATP